MKRLIILILFFMPFLASCAAGPPARIEGGTYINTDFEFSIRPPEGWQVSKKPPDWLKGGLPYNLRRMIRIVFFNSDTNGMIVISSEKTIFDLSRYDSDKLKDAFVKEIEKQRKQSGTGPRAAGEAGRAPGPGSGLRPLRGLRV